MGSVLYRFDGCACILVMPDLIRHPDGCVLDPGSESGVTLRRLNGPSQGGDVFGADEFNMAVGAGDFVLTGDLLFCQPFH